MNILEILMIIIIIYLKEKENLFQVLMTAIGITDNDIIEWITKNNLLETENHDMIESLCPKILVEINTCNSMWLISEII